MKKILRYIIIFCFSLITAKQLFANLVFDEIPFTILLVSLTLTIFELILKPLIKILLLPITLLTLGLIRTLIDTLGIYLALFLIDGFHLQNINIPQSQYQGIIIPAINFYGFWAVLASSALISFLFYLYSKILTVKVSQ